MKNKRISANIAKDVRSGWFWLYSYFILYLFSENVSQSDSRHLSTKQIHWFLLGGVHTKLGGGFKFQTFFLFTPITWKISNLTSIFFRWVGSTTKEKSFVQFFNPPIHQSTNPWIGASTFVVLAGHDCLEAAISLPGCLFWFLWRRDVCRSFMKSMGCPAYGNSHFYSRYPKHPHFWGIHYRKFSGGVDFCFQKGTFDGCRVWGEDL